MTEVSYLHQTQAERDASSNGGATKAQKATEVPATKATEPLRSPRSLSSQGDMPSWPQLDPVALYGLPGEFVSTVEPHTEADPAGLLLDFLASFGNAVGPGPHAMADASPHPARLFVVLVGETSKARKGTTRANVRAVFEIADPTWATTRVRSGIGSGEGIIQAVAEDDDGRLFVYESEFARTLHVAERSGSTVSPIIRDCWDTGRLSTITRNPLRAEGAHVGIIGHITREEARRCLVATEVANGYANRFQFGCVKRSRLLPNGGSVDSTDRAALGSKVHAALKAAADIGLVTRTPEAEARWDELYREMADDDPGGLVGAVTARAEAQTLRLSVAYALTDGKAEIDVDHLDAAYAVWKFCRDSAAFIFGDSLGDDVADTLLNALRAAGDDGLDGTQQRDLFARHVSGSRLANARSLLETRQLALTTQVDTGGRPRNVTVALNA